MRVLRPILRSLLAAPLKVRVIDDQRSWKAIHLYLGALHLARKIEQASDRPNVGLMLPTSGLFPMGLLATWLLGRTAVPLNYLLKPEELAYVIDDAELDVVVTVTPMITHFGDLPDGVKQLRLDKLEFKGMPRPRRAVRRPDDFTSVLLYTSGTSGKPKGVMLTSANLAANVQQCREWIEFTPADSVVGVLPQFHSFGLTALTLLPLSVGARAVYTARFQPKKILKLLGEHKPLAFIAIPSMYAALLHAKSAKAEHFEAITYLCSGGEPLPRAVFDGYQDRFGVRLCEGYGLTETAPVTNLCRPQEFKPGSVGRALPRVDEKITGPDGQRLGVDEEGEICITGPNVMKGYYKLPDETARVFDDEGFFKTGDMGRIDADGHLFITGRIKEMLIIGGENVFPREIEEVLNQHPDVVAAAVIGAHDDLRGEVPLAFVELVEDASFDEAAVRSFCRETLAQYKVPREIRVLDALPRNPTGKIMRRELSVDTAGSTV